MSALVSLIFGHEDHTSLDHTDGDVLDLVEPGQEEIDSIRQDSDKFHQFTDVVAGMEELKEVLLTIGSESLSDNHKRIIRATGQFAAVTTGHSASKFIPSERAMTTGVASAENISENIKAFMSGIGKFFSGLIKKTGNLISKIIFALRSSGGKVRKVQDLARSCKETELTISFDSSKFNLGSEDITTFEDVLKQKKKETDRAIKIAGVLKEMTEFAYEQVIKPVSIVIMEPEVSEKVLTTINAATKTLAEKIKKTCEMGNRGSGEYNFTAPDIMSSEKTLGLKFEPKDTLKDTISSFKVGDCDCSYRRQSEKMIDYKLTISEINTFAVYFQNSERVIDNILTVVDHYIEKLDKLSTAIYSANSHTLHNPNGPDSTIDMRSSHVRIIESAAYKIMFAIGEVAWHCWQLIIPDTVAKMMHRALITS